MLVRLKKRGEFPEHGSRGDGLPKVPLYSLFRGAIIEVEPFLGGRGTYTCKGKLFKVTDSRLLALIPPCAPEWAECICSHFLIDDLNAYDSDSCDEQAEVGDIAFAEVSIPVKVTI